MAIMFVRLDLLADRVVFPVGGYGGLVLRREGTRVDLLDRQGDIVQTVDAQPDDALRVERNGSYSSAGGHWAQRRRSKMLFWVFGGNKHEIKQNRSGSQGSGKLYRIIIHASGGAALLG